MRKNTTKISMFFSSLVVGVGAFGLSSCKEKTSYYWSFKDYKTLANFTYTQKFISLTSKKPIVQDYDENADNYVSSEKMGGLLQDILTAGDMSQIMIYSLFNFFQIISFVESFLDNSGPQFDPVTQVTNIFLSVAKHQIGWDIKMGFDYNDGNQIKKPFVSYSPEAPQWEDNAEFLHGIDIPPTDIDLPFDIFITFFNPTADLDIYWNTSNWAPQIVEGFNEFVAHFFEDLLDSQWVTLLEWQFKIIFPNWELEFFNSQGGN